MVAEDQHNTGPRERRKRRPGVFVDHAAQRLGGYHGESMVGLHGDACEGQHHARKDVDDDLLVDR